MNTIRKKANTITISNHFWDCSAGLPTAPVETQNYIIIQVAESYYKNHFSTPGHLQSCDLELTYALTNGLTSPLTNRRKRWIKMSVIFLLETIATNCPAAGAAVFKLLP